MSANLAAITFYFYVSSIFLLNTYTAVGINPLFVYYIYYDTNTK